MGVISCGTTMIDNGAFQGLAVLSWDTTAKTSNFTAVAGNGYFVNTTSASITVTLPSSPSAGDQVAIKDYAATAGTNKIVVARNGSNINGAAANVDIVRDGESATLLYVDGTQGWSVIMDGNKDAAQDQKFITATGGTITTCGDYKIHTFTGPGTFCVSCAGSPTGSTQVDYLIVGGGGGAAGGGNTSGGGAGGLRESPGEVSAYNINSVGASLEAFTVSATGYPVTVGAGGSGGNPFPPTNQNGATGSNSSVFSNTAAGGGGSRHQNGTPPSESTGLDGGSGGGGYASPNPASKRRGGDGNVPAVSVAQGNPGGYGDPRGPLTRGGGGGGMLKAGSNGCSPTGNADYSDGGKGGDGVTTAIKGGTDAFAGGGSGSYQNYASIGGGGPAGPPSTFPGTANTGGGGGGRGPCGVGGSGGSGIVIIRYKYQ